MASVRIGQSCYHLFKAEPHARDNTPNANCTIPTRDTSPNALKMQGAASDDKRAIRSEVKFSVMYQLYQPFSSRLGPPLPAVFQVTKPDL